MLTRLRSALDGLFWLLRPTGLSKQLRALDHRFDRLDARLLETETRVAQLVSPTNVPVPVHGHLMYVDRHDTLALAIHHTHEPYQTELVQKLIAPGDHVVDAGAHIGYYTLLFARCVGASGRVTALEPAPHARFMLHRNVHANGYSGRVRVVDAALHEKPGPVPFWTCDEGLVGGALHAPGDGWPWEKIDVPGVPLDDLVQPGDRVDLVKMDIQGGEAAAIAGMSRVLAENPKVRLLLEFWPRGLVLTGTSPRDLLDRLTQAGFRLTEVRDEERAMAPVDPDELIARLPPDELGGHTNLLCERVP